MATLDYERRLPVASAGWWRLIWLTPFACAGILALHEVFGKGDDLYWLASIGLACVLSAICYVKGRRGMAIYCLAIAMLLLLISVLLPTFNRAT